MVLDDENPWDGILESTVFALRATVLTIMQCTPIQLVLRQDSILNTCLKANWQIIKKHKQDLTNEKINKELAIKKKHVEQRRQSPT